MNTITRDQIPTATQGRKFLTISENGRLRIQLRSRRKDGSDFETLTVVEPDPVDEAIGMTLSAPLHETDAH